MYLFQLNTIQFTLNRQQCNECVIQGGII